MSNVRPSGCNVIRTRRFRERNNLVVEVDCRSDNAPKPAGWTWQTTLAAASAVISLASLFVAGRVAWLTLHRSIAAEVSILDAQVAAPVSQGRELRFMIAISNSGNTQVVLTAANGILLTNDEVRQTAFVNGPQTEGMSRGTLEPGKIALATIYVQLPRKLLRDASTPEHHKTLANPSCKRTSSNFAIHVDALVFGADGKHYRGSTPQICVYVADGEVTSIQAFAGSGAFHALDYDSYSLSGK